MESTSTRKIQPSSSTQSLHLGQVGEKQHCQQPVRPSTASTSGLRSGNQADTVATIRKSTFQNLRTSMLQTFHLDTILLRLEMERDLQVRADCKEFLPTPDVQDGRNLGQVGEED